MADDVITIENQAFRLLVNKIDTVYGYVVEENKQEKVKKQVREQLLDTNEVCQLLRISKRTLQRLRDEKVITFAYLGGKCIYKLKDVENLVDLRLISCDTKHFMKILSELEQKASKA